MSELPALFIERLHNIFPKGYFDVGLKSFSIKKPVCIRVNTIKTTKEKVLYFCRKQKISFREVNWYHDALVLDGISTKEVTDTYLFKNGHIYIQSLSSMLVALVVDPKPGEHILDMCAAPGGKATQMASLMHNSGSILAIDAIRPRYYKLKSVVLLLGADIIDPKLTDARKFSRGVTHFDRILVDASCSCEGRFRTFDKKSYAYWSLRKIKEMARKQKGLLLAASRLLKPGGILVYSTCTFAPEENETVVDWLLKKTNNALRVMSTGTYPLLTSPALKQFNNRIFNEQIANCLRILPDETMEGAFIAKLMKIS